MFKAGDTVYSIYDGMRGKIIGIFTSGIRYEYRIKWRDGLVSCAYREELCR